MDAFQGFDAVLKAGSTGALVWVVWYVLSRGIPNIIQMFTAELAAQRTQFTGALEAQRTDSKEERELFRTESQAARDHCREEIDRLTQRSVPAK